METFKEKLTKALLENGAQPQTFSIDDPKNYVLNFAQTPLGWQVWFQEDGGKYELKTYDNRGQAVYEFATRLINTHAADRIARMFQDPDLKVYS